MSDIKILYNNVLDDHRNNKSSVGIACFRFNKVYGNKLEILLVKKRYTHNFAAFVLGQFSNNEEKLQSLLNGMTSQEKLDILSLNFDLLWYKIWLRIPKKNEYDNYSTEFYDRIRIIEGLTKRDPMHIFYLKKKAKFETLFLADSGEKLKRLIKDTKNAEINWEIPKGRQKKGETSLDCAIREFREETSIDITGYKLLFNIEPIKDLYINCNVKYESKYYVAIINDSDHDISKFNVESAREVECAKWVPINDLRIYNGGIKIYKTILNTLSSLR